MTIPLTEILSFLAFVLVVSLVQGLFAEGLTWAADHSSDRWRKSNAPIFVIGLLSIAAAMLCFAVYFRMPVLLPKGLVRVGVGTPAIFFGAGFLFLLKVEHLMVYARLEIAFGLAFVAKTLWGMGDVIEPLDTLSLLAAAYLLVRGFDNVKKASEDEKAKEKPPAGDQVT